MSHLLRISDLHVSVEDLPILNGVDLEIRTGEIHALMGPNGSGKSTLAYALAGHPKYQITRGKVEIDGTDLLALDPNERARLGLFLAFQYPVTIPGVKVADFLRHAASNVRNPNRKEGEGLIAMRDFRRELRARMEELGIEAGIRPPLFERRLFRRRKEADGDSAVGHARAAICRARRDRQRPRQRRRPRGERGIGPAGRARTWAC